MKNVAIVAALLVFAGFVVSYAHGAWSERHAELRAAAEALEARASELSARFSESATSIEGQIVRLDVLYDDVDSQLERSTSVLEAILEDRGKRTGDVPSFNGEVQTVVATQERRMESEGSLSLEERYERARAVMRRVKDDEELAALTDAYTRGGRSYPNWRLSEFLSDPRINKAGRELDELDRFSLQVLYQKHTRRIESVDTRYKLVAADGISRKLQEAADARKRGEDPQDILLPGGNVVFMSNHNGVRVHLTEEECPELSVLASERRPAMVGWLIEACGFFENLR